MLEYDATKYIPILADTDLDSLIMPGVYFCANYNTAITLKNCPVQNSFKMVVEQNGNYDVVLSQKIVSENNLFFAPWCRMKNSESVWGGWFNYVTKNDLNYSISNAKTLKGITFSAKKNRNLVALYVGGTATEAVSIGTPIGELWESIAVSGYVEFVVYDIKNHTSYSMTIDSDRNVRIYGQNLPAGAQLRGAVTYFAPNT